MHPRLPVRVLCILVGLLAVAMAVLAQGPLTISVFYSPACDYCNLVKEQVLPALEAQYGQQLTWRWVDASTAEGLAELEAIEARLNDRDNPVPVFVLGEAGEETLIADEDLFALREALEAELAARLAGPGGAAAPAAAATNAQSQATSVSANPGAGGQPAIHVAYIKKEGCETCSRATLALDAVAGAFPQMVVTTFDVLTQGDVVEAMGQALNLPAERRLIAPSIYVGDAALVGGEEITSGALRELLSGYSATGAPAFWQTLDVVAGRNSIARRFRAMGPLAVVAAALIDGINPCAFATILFFASYLAISRRSRGALLALGLAFTAGVFLTYLVVGLGAMSLLRLVSAISVVGKVIYGLFGLVCLALAGVSLSDYRLARQGRLHEMRLNLPDPLRERIKSRIRKGSTAFLGAAFLSGLVVSLLELACTGQVYLPTITFMVSVPEMRAAATGYLVLYNLVFVLPLLVVLVLATYGVSAARFQDWFVRHAAAAKLVMAVLFLVLGLLLAAKALGLW